MSRSLRVTSLLFALGGIGFILQSSVANAQLRPDPNAPGSAWGADQIAQLIAGLGGSTTPSISAGIAALDAGGSSKHPVLQQQHASIPAESMFQSGMRERPEPGASDYAGDHGREDEDDDHHGDERDDYDDEGKAAALSFKLLIQLGCLLPRQALFLLFLCRSYVLFSLPFC